MFVLHSLLLLPLHLLPAVTAWSKSFRQLHCLHTSSAPAVSHLLWLQLPGCV